MLIILISTFSSHAYYFPGLFWSAHQRFFRSLCIASKVDKAVSLAKKALEDGHCVIIGLQSTGEARAKGAAKVAGFDADSGGEFDDYISAPNEDLKRIIMMMFPLPPKPKGVIAPVFLNPLKKGNDDDDDDESIADENSVEAEEVQGKRKRWCTKKTAVPVGDLEGDDEEEDDDDDEEDDDDESYDENAIEADEEDDDDTDDDMVGSEEEDDDDDSKANKMSAKRKSKGDRSSLATKKQKTSETSKVRGKRIPWDQIPLDLDVTRNIENQRLVNYRKAAEVLKHYMEAVDKLELPPNPLDR